MPPSRIGSVFRATASKCPVELATYATCVTVHAESTHSIEKHACDKEFKALKDCFRKIHGKSLRK